MSKHSDSRSPEANPWKTVSSKEIYKNPWIRVREDQVTRPDGNPGIYGVVETKIACGVVAITPQREVYLVGQYRYPTNYYSWEIIEGGADLGEDSLTAIKRELREEAGLLAEHWQPLGDDMHLSNCFSSEVARLYVAQNFTDTVQAPDPTEVLTIRKLPLEDCLGLVYDGTIKDAMSIIGLLRIDQLLRENKLQLLA